MCADGHHRGLRREACKVGIYHDSLVLVWIPGLRALNRGTEKEAEEEEEVVHIGFGRKNQLSFGR